MNGFVFSYITKKYFVNIILALLISLPTLCHAQAVDVKTNLLYAAATTPNIGVEFSLAERITFDFSGRYKGWAIGKSMIHFRVGASNVDLNYMNNRATLSRITEALTSENASYISLIRIEGYTSPEGGSAVNERLAKERAEALRQYIMHSSSYIQPEKISAQGMGVNWNDLRELADTDYNLPRRSEVLYIIDHVHAHIDFKANVSRKKSLMDLGTKTWNYMLVNYFPKLRTGITIIMMADTPEDIINSISNTLGGIKDKPIPAIDTVKNVIPEPVKIADQYPVTDSVSVERVIEKVEEEEVRTLVLPTRKWEKKPLFALKTNLLFDAVSALNVEIEIPIGKRWSIAGEYVFPWWLWEKKQIAFEMLYANIEGRYWFGDRTDKKLLMGWYMGLYAGGGYFDFEWKDKGYQGEFFIAAGVSAGYAHTISKNGNWRMEYGLGLGYLHTQYREYVPKFGSDGEWHLIRQRDGKHTWLGPTKAKVSLVWMINGNKKGGGIR